jgi:hypothetical protein
LASHVNFISEIGGRSEECCGGGRRRMKEKTRNVEGGRLGWEELTFAHVERINKINL